jgi:hypothetical protein
MPTAYVLMYVYTHTNKHSHTHIHTFTQVIINSAELLQNDLADRINESQVCTCVRMCAFTYMSLGIVYVSVYAWIYVCECE